MWDWGDGNQSEWSPFHSSDEPVTGNHTWSKQGVYEVKVKARDFYFMESNWSQGLKIHIYGLPNPCKPVGSDFTETGRREEYSVEVKNHTANLSCMWDWGDGSNSSWLGPFQPGEKIKAEHTWNKRGVYNVRAKIRDNSDIESNWSEPLTVHVLGSELTVDIIKGRAYVKNIGEKTAFNITWFLNITGGFFNRINVYTQGSIPQLKPDEETMVKNDKPVFGFGNIKIEFKTITVGNIVYKKAV